MRMPMPWNLFGTPRRAGRDVDAGLDGQRHARLEHAPFVADLVVADVVHVHAEPVAGAVHEELAIGAVSSSFATRALEQAELDQALRDDAHRGIVRLVPVVARLHLRDGRVVAPRARCRRRARCSGEKRPLTGKVRVMSEA